MTGLRSCLKTLYDRLLAEKVLAARRLVLTAWQTCSRCKANGVGFSNNAETTLGKSLLPAAVPMVSNPTRCVHLCTLSKDRVDSHKADRWDFSADHVFAFLRFKRDA